jgi:hypothetical protein
MTTAEGVPIRIAALPMYDFPELRDAHDRLWTAYAESEVPLSQFST